MSEKENIYQRINAVMQTVKYVQKDANVDGKYSAVTHDQVVAVVRPALVENGIVVVPEQVASEIVLQTTTRSGAQMHLYGGDYRVHFVNVDNPEDRITVPINAHGVDNSDKAPGKAISYAVKYAILKLLSLETGESDEDRMEIKEGKQQLISAAQKKEVEAIVNGSEDAFLKLLRMYQVESIEQMTVANLKDLKAKYEAKNADH
jgi:hypothetical protein